MPLNLRFRLRERSQNLSYAAESCNIHPDGIQITTDAPLQKNMHIEIWPEDEMGMQLKDYVEGTHFVHGNVAWVRGKKADGKNTFGISFNRQIDWLIPMQALTEHLTTSLSPDNQDEAQTSNATPLCLEEIEKQAILEALSRNNWKRMKTCRELGISKDTLRRKISRYELLGKAKEKAPKKARTLLPRVAAKVLQKANHL